MKILFVGTSSGETSRTRNHSSLLIQSDDHNLLIDCGDGISKALLNFGIDFNSIGSVLLTHNHADHFAGLASLITQMKIHMRSQPLQIVTHSNLVSSLKSFLISSYLFKEKLEFKINFIPFNFGIRQKLASNISFTSKQNSHIVQTELLEEYPREIFVSSSVLIEPASKKIFYTSDIGSREDLFLFKEEKFDWLITETTHIDIDILFSSFKETGAVKFFLTHYNDETENLLIEKCKKLRPEEQANVKICHDGDIIQID